MSKNLHTTCLQKDLSRESQFAVIFQEQEYKVYTLALRLTKSDYMAKDIVQEVFLKLWQHKDRLDEIENIEAYLYRAVEYKLFDFMKKAANDARLRSAIWQNTQQTSVDPEMTFVAKEYNGILKKAVDELPAQRKAIYKLSREKGMNYKEISSELNISSHTVKNQLYEAVKTLRSSLKQFLHLQSA